MTVTRIIINAIIAVLLVSGFAAGKNMSVMVSVPPQAFLVDRIGGEHVTVDYCIPPGASPPTYSPTPKQVAAIATCQLYFSVGHPGFIFEAKHIDPILSANASIEIVSISDDKHELVTETEDFHHHHHGGGDGDPHLWLSFELYRQAAGKICSTLVSIDPQNSADYIANCGKLISEIDDLKQTIANRYTHLNQRCFMVFHPVWGYFASEFELEQIPIETDGKEPSARQIVGIIDMARTKNITRIIVQKGFARKSAEVIANETGARIIELDPLAYDWLINMEEVSNMLVPVIINDQ